MYSIKLMQFDVVSYNGELTTKCFAHGGLTQAQLMDDCVNCLAYDDQVHHPDCYGYRIFLDPRISVCHSHSESLSLNLPFYTCLHQSMSLMQMLLHPEGHDLGTSGGEFNMDNLVNHVCQILPRTDLSKAKLVSFYQPPLFTSIRSLISWINILQL
jgi:hypothetical protein